MKGDNKSGSGVKTLDDDVAKLKKLVDAIKTAQELAMKAHLLYVAKLAVEYNTNGYNMVVLPLMVSGTEILPTKENAEKYFGLKRNSKGIKYLKTVNIDNDFIPHTVANPFPLAAIIKYARDKLGGIISEDDAKSVEDMLGLGDDIYEEKVYEQYPESWYITADNFSEQKTFVILRDNTAHYSSPLFARLLDIKQPKAVVYSAAAAYNTKGTMFPTEESDLLGPSDTQLVSYAGTALQAGIYILRIVKQDKTPYRILSIGVTAYLAGMTIYVASKISDGEKNSPISNYNKAKSGGWAAHLTPYKVEEEN